MKRWIALPRSAPRLRRRGITLLELILALSLSVLLLGAIAMAIRLNLRSLDSRRADVEEAQLARAVLRMIADDLHSAVQHEIVDFSPLESMAQSSVASQAAAAAAASAASGGGNAASGASGGGGGSTSSTTSKTTTTTTSKSGSGGGGGGGGSPGSTKTTTTKTTTTTTTSPSGGSSGGSSSGAASGSSGDSGSSTDTSSATEDIASTTTPPPIPGLYGNQYELQIDVSRLPRLDEYQQAMANTGGALTDIPSAVKTVAYYLRGQGAAPTNTGFGASGVLSMQDAQRPGLVRRQLDRAVTLQASQSGSSTSIMQQGDLIAPEVVSIEFRYSDGTQWLTEWDSNQMQGLPVAVEILVGLQPALAYVDPNDVNSGNSTLAKQATNQPPRMYRHVVRLPAGKVPATTTESTEGSTTDTTDSSTGTSSTGSTSGTTK